MKTMQKIELNALQAIAGGDNTVTEICDTFRGAYIRMMQDAKARGMTFAQFLASLSPKLVPSDFPDLQAFWDSL